MGRAEDVRSWMALAGRRIDVLHLLVEHPAAGFTTAEVALYLDLPLNIALTRLRGLEMMHEAEQRGVRWFATTRGQAVIVSFDEWLASEEIPY